MTAHLLLEQRITFTALANEQGVSPATVWRWASRGIKGHVLESFNLGLKKFTTREAFERWVALTNGEPLPVETNRQAEARQRSARKELAAAGMID